MIGKGRSELIGKVINWEKNRSKKEMPKKERKKKEMLRKRKEKERRRKNVDQKSERLKKRQLLLNKLRKVILYPREKVKPNKGNDFIASDHSQTSSAIVREWWLWSLVTSRN